MTTQFVLVNLGPGTIEVIPTHYDTERQIYAEPVKIAAGGTLTGKHVFPGQEFLIREVYP